MKICLGIFEKTMSSQYVEFAVLQNENLRKIQARIQKTIF